MRRKRPNPLLWGLGGAAACLLVVVAILAAALARVANPPVRGAGRLEPAVSSAPAVSGAPPASNAPAPPTDPPDQTVTVRSAAGPAAAPVGRLSPQDVIARVKRSVVLVLVEGPNGVVSGTGFPVGPHTVATCAHVVKDAQRVALFTGRGKQIEAHVGKTDPDNDVAVLSCGRGLPSALPLAGWEGAREGDEIAVTGYPLMNTFLDLGYVPTASTTRGSISAKRLRATSTGTLRELQTDAAIAPGNSGGPLYSLRTGAVLGLAASRFRGQEGIGFAIPADALQPLVIAANTSLEPPDAEDPDEARHDSSEFGASKRAAIRLALDGWHRAIRRDDLDSDLEYYAPTVDYFTKGRWTREQIRADRARFYAAPEHHITWGTPEFGREGERYRVVEDATFDTHTDHTYAAKVRVETLWAPVDGRLRIVSQHELRVYWHHRG